MLWLVLLFRKPSKPSVFLMSQARTVKELQSPIQVATAAMANRKNRGLREAWPRLGPVAEIGGARDGMGWDGSRVSGCSRERF